ncbi:MAG: response regulator transcription factor [Bacteroidaceae bacterium]|nr:response regulator transcription factor [Bacteroidaceae bacterium]MBR5764689.1 response regulator transcription factor [Bacteroidaceae bacterium]
MKNKVVLLSDSEIVSMGMTAIIGSMPDVVLVERTSSIELAQSAIIHNRAEILIVEPHIIDYSSRNNIRNVFHNIPSTLSYSIIAIASHYTERDVLKQFDGCIELSDSVGRIEEVLRQCRSDEKPKDEAVAESSIYAMNEDLSERELEVLIAVAKGLQNKEIAETLNISVHTVMSHRKNIIAKTGIKSIAGLTVYALMNGLIEESAIK